MHLDTYLLWALNTLFQELLDPLASTSNANGSNNLFQSLLTSSTANVPSMTGTLPQSPSSFASYASALPQGTAAPIPDAGAPASVQSAIQAAAAATGLSPALLKAVATVESGLNPTAVSSAGAVGLMQLMPSTAATLGVDPTNTASNALGGAEYLKGLLNQFGQNLSLALAAYNAGPGAVEHYGGVPPYAQTQHYVQDVLNAYQNYGGATPASSSSIG